MIWTPEMTKLLSEQYPCMGKEWCMREMNLSEGQVRQKASRLKLVARGVSEAWQQKQKDHSQKLTGRKRPDQSLVMKRLHEDGKLLKTAAQRVAIGARTKTWIKKNGHPRGATGLHHSEATKLLIGKKSELSWLGMSEETKAERTMKMMRTRAARGLMVMPRPEATWKGGWRVVGGKRIYFRSRWEANYGRVLEWLKQRGEITEWEHEPDTFWFDGIKRGCVSYLPDFKVWLKGGTIEYHEVKGWMDARSRTKIERMGKYHPRICLRVIDSKSYKTLTRQMAGLIKDWE